MGFKLMFFDLNRITSRRFVICCQSDWKLQIQTWAKHVNIN